MLSVLFLTRGSAIAVDLAVIILTWIKTFGHWRRLRQLHISASATDVLIRDGKRSSFLIVCTFQSSYGTPLQAHYISCELLAGKPGALRALTISLRRALLAMNTAQILTYGFSSGSAVSF